jgi:hypothetical protein
MNLALGDPGRVVPHAIAVKNRGRLSISSG